MRPDAPIAEILGHSKSKGHLRPHLPVIRFEKDDTKRFV